MTEFLLVRHGETAWNRELRFQGQRDIPLNDMGWEQARRVAVRLGGEAADVLLSSDLLRARETAQPTGDAKALALVLEPDLREQSFGLVEGLTAHEIRAQHPEVLAHWARFDADYQIPHGESVRQFSARVLGAMQRLAQQHVGQRLIVVTHGGVLDMIYRSAKGMPLNGPRQCEIPNGGINQVHAALDRTGALHLEIVSWGDAEHLADMPAQPRYDQARVAGQPPR